MVAGWRRGHIPILSPPPKLLTFAPLPPSKFLSWLISYSKYTAALEPFYEAFDAEWLPARTAAREVLQKEDDLNEIVQLVGKDSLAEGDKVTLETAKFLKEDYLQQNSFTKYDKYCPFYKSVWMLRNIMAFHALATAAVERPATGEGAKLTFATIRTRLGALLRPASASTLYHHRHVIVIILLTPAHHSHLFLSLLQATSCTRSRPKSSRTPPTGRRCSRGASGR